MSWKHQDKVRSLRWNDYITETDELRDDSLQMKAIYLSRGSSTRSILHCRNWISGRRNARKEGRQTIFFTPLDPFNSDADEAESVAVCPQHKMLVKDFGNRFLMPLLCNSLCPRNAS